MPTGSGRRERERGDCKRERTVQIQRTVGQSSTIGGKETSESGRDRMRERGQEKNTSERHLLIRRSSSSRAKRPTLHLLLVHHFISRVLCVLITGIYQRAE
jgi:hypothetical protein